jgi:hypothetical protein
MFARAVSIKVKPGCEVELTRILEQEVIPRCRQERDFLGLLAFIGPDGTEALSLSLWDQEKSARANCPANLCALTALASVIRGTPSVQVYKVSNTTLHTMEEMLGQGKGVEATPDLKIYQACATAFPIVARTVHAELRFPASYEFNAQGNPILGRRSRTRTPLEAVQASVASHEFNAQGNPILGRRGRTRTPLEAVQE